VASVPLSLLGRLTSLTAVFFLPRGTLVLGSILYCGVCALFAGQVLCEPPAEHVRRDDAVSHSDCVALRRVCLIRHASSHRSVRICLLRHAVCFAELPCLLPIARNLAACLMCGGCACSPLSFLPLTLGCPLSSFGWTRFRAAQTGLDLQALRPRRRRGEAASDAASYRQQVRSAV
jgi:hypothetical protein